MPTLAAVESAPFFDQWYGQLIAALAVVLGAFVVRWVAFKIIDRTLRPMAVLTAQSRGASKVLLAGATSSTAALQRSQQRAATLLSLARSVVTIVIATVAVAAVLSIYGVSLTAMLASAGVLSVALGFGAQSLVRDYLSGIAMIMEDQFGVGDVVDMGEAIGTVERVSLRITRLRDSNGVVWFVPNGQVVRLANRSRGWALAVVDVPAAVDQDIDRAVEVMTEAARAMAADLEVGEDLLGEPEVVGVESMTATSVTLRVVAKVRPLARLPVQRELRARVIKAFEAQGVRLPAPSLPQTPPAPPVTGGS